MADPEQEADEPEVVLLPPDIGNSKAGGKAGTPQWNQIEVLAGCKAALSANESVQTGKVADLEAFAQK
eukprot:6192308-Pleurochrysis_carterae.AAC.1